MYSILYTLLPTLYYLFYSILFGEVTFKPLAEAVAVGGVSLPHRQQCSGVVPFSTRGQLALQPAQFGIVFGVGLVWSLLCFSLVLHGRVDCAYDIVFVEDHMHRFGTRASPSAPP